MNWSLPDGETGKEGRCAGCQAGERLQEKHGVMGDNEKMSLCRKDGFVCVHVHACAHVCVFACAYWHVVDETPRYM